MKREKNSLLIKAAELICIIVLALMTLVCFVNVCSRYILHVSIAASEEITTNLFVVLSLVGAALAARGHSHIGLNIFTDRLSPRGKLFHKVFEGLVGMVFMGFLSWYGYLRVQQQFITGQESAGLGLPIWMYGLLCLICFLIVFAVFTEIMVTAVVRLAKPDYETNAGALASEEEK